MIGRYRRGRGKLQGPPCNRFFAILAVCSKKETYVKAAACLSLKIHKAAELKKMVLKARTIVANAIKKELSHSPT